MGLFEDFGVSANEVNENPFEITKPNRYACVVTDSEIKEFGQDGNKKPYWIVSYSINDGGENDGKGANTMHRLVPWTPEERAEKGDYKAMNARLLSGYKKELLNLGIPESAMNAFDPKNPAHREKVIGIRGSAWFGPDKGNPGFNRVSDFKRADAEAPSSASTSAANGTGTATTEKPKDDVDIDAMMNW